MRQQKRPSCTDNFLLHKKVIIFGCTRQEWGTREIINMPLIACTSLSKDNKTPRAHSEVCKKSAKNQRLRILLFAPEKMKTQWDFRALRILKGLSRYL